MYCGSDYVWEAACLPDQVLGTACRLSNHAHSENIYLPDKVLPVVGRRLLMSCTQLSSWCVPACGCHTWPFWVFEGLPEYVMRGTDAQVLLVIAFVPVKMKRRQAAPIRYQNQLDFLFQ